RTQGRGVDQIASVSGNEELADAMAAENQFWRNATVGATDDRRPGRLVRRDCTALRRQVDRAEFWVADIALVSRFQLGERLVGRERGRRAFGRACLSKHAAEAERDAARRAELQQVPPNN